MKILHVTNHFYPCVGGIERYVLDLCRELIKKGHKSDVACLNTCANSKKKLPDEETIDGITVRRMPYLNLKYYKIAPSVIRLLKDYDIIHIHGVGFFLDFLWITKAMHKKPMILSTHGGIFATKNIGAIKRIYFGTVTRTTLKSMDHVIATGRNEYAIFSKICKNLKLIEPGIDYGKFSSIKRGHLKNTFLFVGRISKNKRIDNIIKTAGAAKKMSQEIVVRIAGEDWDGSMNDLISLSRSIGAEKNIIFAGKVTDAELMKYYAESQFFVSASEYEGFGISVAESMAAGCIPILNDIKAFRALVDDGKNGFIVDFSDPDSAAKRIIGIKNLPEGAKQRIANSAKKSAMKYDWKKISAKIERLYRESAMVRQFP